MNEKLKQYLESLPEKIDVAALNRAIDQGKTILVDGQQGPTGKTTLYNLLQEAGVPVLEARDVYHVRLNRFIEKQTPQTEQVTFLGGKRESVRTR